MNAPIILLTTAQAFLAPEIRFWFYCLNIDSIIYFIGLKKYFEKKLLYFTNFNVN